MKDTNPKDAVGTGKVPLSTIPTEVIAELGLVMLEGARKYGRHNYREAGVRASVYFDAAMRHWMRFWEGEDLDPDSGMPHLVHAMACAAVLRDSQVVGNWTDDRPPKLPDGWIDDYNAKAKAIVEKYPNPLPAHTELARGTSSIVARPTTVYALSEDWMREHEWLGTGDITYTYRNGAWSYYWAEEWVVSIVNASPDAFGPYKLKQT